MEHKEFAFQYDASALEGGKLVGIAAVFGNVDTGGDRILKGAFTKTLQARAKQIKVGWQHNLDHPFAVPTVVKEIDRSELPLSVLALAPDATGGLYVEAEIIPTAKNQERKILMQWEASNGQRGVDGLSIGYVPMREQFTKEAGQTVRNLPEIKFFEFSPVTLGMNEAAIPTLVKAADLDTKADEQTDISLAAQAIALVNQMIEDEAGELATDADEASDIYTLLQVRTMLTCFAESEASEESGKAAAVSETKIGKPISKTNKDKLMQAHDHLHGVLGMKPHGMDAEADDGEDAAADGKAAFTVKLRLIQAKAQMAMLEAKSA